MAFVGFALQRHQHVGLGKIGGHAAQRNLVRHNDKPLGCARCSAKIIVQVYHLIIHQTRRFHVGRIHKNNPSLVINAPVTVVQAINGGVKLVVAANGRHQKFVGLEWDCFQRVGRKFRFFRVSSEPFFAGRVGQIKTTILAHPLVVMLKTWHYFFD